MNRIAPARRLAAAAALIILAGCGANQDQAGKAPVYAARVSQAAPGEAPAAADYASLVQQLYVSYFGRPADTGGLVNFENQLAEIGGPADVQLLLQAYDSDSRIKTLVDSFGASAESAALFGGDNSAFVTAIYQNVLGRAPQLEGFNYWLGKLNAGTITRANASLAILAGALANTSDQGLRDAALVNKKVTVSSAFTDALVAAPVNGYSGGAAAARARAMLSALTASTDSATYQAAISTLVDELKTPWWLLQTPYRNWLAQASSTSFLVSGMCTGSSTLATAAPASATFDGVQRTASSTVSSWLMVNCSPTTFSSTEVSYLNDSTDLAGSAITSGSVIDSAEFVTYANLPTALPATVKVGDGATYGSGTIYSSSSKSTVVGQRSLSYTVRADDGSNSTAIATFIATNTDSTGQALSTLQTSYRLGAGGSISLVATDAVYNGSGVHLVRKAQPTALAVTDTVVGTGAEAVAGNRITVNYTGWLYDPTVGNRHGTQFDSSVGRAPFSFTLGAGQVIAGWDQGVAGMRVGGRRTLVIPSNLGYGVNGAGSSIPPNAGMVFDVELVSVQ